MISRLDTCSWVFHDIMNNTFLFDWPIWDYGNDSINTGYMDPHNIEHSVATAVSTFRVASHFVRAWPGQKFPIELTAWDQFSQPTMANAHLQFITTLQEVKVYLNPEVIVIIAAGVNSTLIKDFTLAYSISPGDALTINSSFGRVIIDNTFNKATKYPASFLLYPLLCPVGYELVPIGRQQGGLECQCEKNNKRIVNCEDDQDRVILEEGYWGAAVLDLLHYRYDLFLYPCPPGYCKCSQNTSLGPSSCAFAYTNSDPDAQCACDRQGILCGECCDGKGVSALLNNCVSCSNAQGLLLLALIVSDAIIFTIIVLADVSLSEWIYPFIFYIQIISYVGSYFSEEFISAERFLHFISSALGFYFVYDFCLYSNMSPLVSYFIRYIPALVAVLLISPIIYIARKMKLRILKHHGVWWIILLLYTHMIHTSMSILHCPSLPDHKFPRWFVNGSISCFTGWHIPLALLAIAVLVVAVILVPLVCLISLKKYLIQSFYWWIYFQDPLTAAYKEKWRWWSSVELARRFIIILFVLSYPRNLIPSLLIMCILLALYGSIQPYKSLVTNTMELVLQTNFIILLALESTSFFRDTFPSLGHRVQAGTGLRNETSEQCSGEVNNHTLSPFTAVLLLCYYFPLFLFIVTASMKLIQYIRNKREQRNQALKRHSTIHCVQRAVTVTTSELYIELKDDM